MPGKFRSALQKAASRMRRLCDPLELAVLAFVLLALWIYFFISLEKQRIFLFADDILRLRLATFSPGDLFAMQPWGGKTWLPLPTLVQGIAAKILPFSLVTNVLLANLAFVTVSAVWIHRLSRRIVPGPASLIAPVLFVISPSTAWLATSALSEPLFIFLLLGECLFLVRSTEGGSLLEFGVAAAFAVLAMVCRYEAWFVSPLPLFLVAVWNRRRGARRGISEFLLAGVTLLAPVGWMVASMIRYGDPLANLDEISALHREFHLYQTIPMALHSMANAALSVTLLGWVLLAAGVLWLIVPRSWRPGTLRLPALWLSLLFFAPLAALFLFSILTRRSGTFLPRFITVWFSLFVVVAVLPFQRVPRRLAAAAVFILIVVLGFDFVRVDQMRPRAFETMGVGAFERIESLARRQGGHPLVAILYPKGKGEVTVNTVYLYAPSVKSESVTVNPWHFAEAVHNCKADYIVFQRNYWLDMKPGPRRTVVYRDRTYVVLGWKPGVKNIRGRAP